MKIKFFVGFIPLSVLMIGMAYLNTIEPHGVHLFFAALAWSGYLAYWQLKERKKLPQSSGR